MVSRPADATQFLDVRLSRAGIDLSSVDLQVVDEAIHTRQHKYFVVPLLWLLWVVGSENRLSFEGHNLLVNGEFFSRHDASDLQTHSTNERPNLVETVLAVISVISENSLVEA